jgi:integrase
MQGLFICPRKESKMAKHKKYRKTFTFEGKRYEVEGNTEVELGMNLAGKMRELEKGVINKNMTVRNWTAKWLKTFKEPKVDAETYDGIESYFENYIFPVIGDMRVCDVKPIHCQEVLNGMEGLSGGYIKKIYFNMKAMLGSAVSHNIARTNPAASDDITIPYGEDGSHRAITPYEREIFLKACDISDYGTWGLFMLYTGAGPGESARLMGRHIDLKERKIFIDGTKDKKKKGNRQRWVPMNDELFKRFSKMKLEPFKPVFTNKDGRPLTDMGMRRHWESIKKEMNILMGCRTDYGELKRLVPPYPLAEDFQMYNLRHTYATDLRDAGVDITVAMYYMGHSTTEMLIKIYTHQTDHAFDDSREKMDAYRASIARTQKNKRKAQG